MKFISFKVSSIVSTGGYVQVLTLLRIQLLHKTAKRFRCSLFESSNSMKETPTHLLWYRRVFTRRIQNYSRTNYLWPMSNKVLPLLRTYNFYRKIDEWNEVLTATSLFWSPAFSWDWIRVFYSLPGVENRTQKRYVIAYEVYWFLINIQCINFNFCTWRCCS